MIKLNGNKYYCCSEISELGLNEISRVFDQYTKYASPYPPIAGILQISEKEREYIIKIKSNLKSKIENYYCKEDENCCRVEVIVNYLIESKHKLYDTMSYDSYIKNIDCDMNVAHYYNFIENTCIDIFLTKLKEL
jgi:hypothetical protein